MTPPTIQFFLHRQVVAQMLKEDHADRFHVRKHPRLHNYDYSTPNYYFITICTWNKACLFWDNNSLNACGQIAQQGLLNIENHFPNVVLDNYVVMPNHIHAILILQEGSENLSVILGQYKSYVSKGIHQFLPEQQIWQTSFHDHVIRDQKSYEKIWLYIKSNPANWQKDCFFTE